MGNILAKFNHVEISWINLKVFAAFEFTYGFLTQSYVIGTLFR